MIKKTTLLAMAGAALVFASGASAQTKKAPAKPAPAPAAEPASSGGVGEGSTELNFFGTLSDQDAFGTLITGGVSLGKYVNDDLLLKFTQTMTIVDGDGFSLFSYAPYGSAEWQFRPDPASPFVLYAGGGVGLSLSQIDAGGFDFFTYSLFLTPVAGAKFFLDERMALTYSLSYQFPLLEETCGDVDCVSSDTTTLQNFLGFSIYY
jgi:hypothetical protein